MELSNRLRAVANMVTKGNVVCDVGCDHGYIPIYLIKEKRSPHVIAMDINEGPLLRAKEHIAKYHMESYIETRLSDGVAKLQIGEARSLVVAGMGGRLMEKILQEGEEKTQAMQELILQPQSEIEHFRQFLRAHDYGILEENMILEEDKFYPMMRVAYGKKDVFVENCEIKQNLADKFGGLLLQNRNSVLKEYLIRTAKNYEQILKNLKSQDMTTEKNRHRFLELSKEMDDIAEAFTYMKA